ncbi:MAG: pro-sigmaK processing inhibitor BofA family protein [Sporolactobacillus sp.]
MTTNILFIAGGAAVLFFLLMIFGNSFHPLKWFGKLTIRLCIGVFMLFLLNVIGESFSLHIPINFATSAVSGLLGLPGLAALVLIKYKLGM